MKRFTTAGLYLSGLVVFGVGVYTFLGITGTLLYGGLVLVGLGGLKSFGRIFWGGIGRYPPSDWYSGKL